MNASEFEILARSLRPRIVRDIRRMVGDDDAEDVAQDVMLKLWSMRASLDEYRSVTVIARRLSPGGCRST